MDAPKNKLVIVYGGQSSEHEATRKSFEYLCDRIKTVGFKKNLEVTHVIYITRDGSAIISNYSPHENLSYYERSSEKTSLVNSLKFIKDNDLFVYAILYGQNGEDGKAQGMSDFLSIKTNLGSVMSCTIAMSKYHLNQYIKGNLDTIKIPKTVCLKETQKIENELLQMRGKYVVVKPNSLGSSIMTEKIFCSSKTLPKIMKLIRQILQFDTRVLIQEYIEGVEYSCSCLEKNRRVISLPAVRIETENNFFGQKEKFLSGYSKETIVNKQNEKSQLKIAREISKLIFIDLDFRNAARFDFIINASGIYFLEANPLPGILSGSIFPKMLRTKGWDIETLVEISYENEMNRKKLKTEFTFKIDQA